jgi:tripeptide aminopeptidase
MTRVNSKRIKDIFLDLVTIDSPSGKEKKVAEWIADFCTRKLGMEVREDDSIFSTGADTGNLVACIDGNTNKTPLFFNAHMDTVEPGTGIKPIFRNGIFSSHGNTVLGADDKAGIAIILEAMAIVMENNIDFGEIELLFTVSEEIGLLGAKAMKPDFLKARHGYALDSSSPDDIITRAPAAIRFDAEFVGRAAHAGLHPEDGINAIQMASRAIANMHLGRIDEETTANVGIIAGGNATNIIPERCRIAGEVRSHSREKLYATRDSIISIMHAACMQSENDNDNMDGSDFSPYLQTIVKEDYPLMQVPDASPLVTTAISAGKTLGRELRVVSTGGGSDANIFNDKGIETVILGIGMSNVHTTDEFITLDDMIQTAALLTEIIRQWQ